jgi:hypothetical protein
MRILLLLLISLNCLGQKFSSGPVSLWILRGQSNAYGVAPYMQAASDLVAPVTDNKIWNIDAQAWQVMQLNVNNGGMPGHVASSAYGVEMRLMKSLQDFYNTPQYLHKYTYYGTYLAQVSGGNPDWSPSSTGENFDLSHVDWAASKNSLPYQSNVKAYIWIQGENDGVDQYSSYQTNLINFISAERAYYGLPNLPFIILRLGDEQTGINSTGLAAVRAAQQYVATNISNCFLVSADGVPTNSSDHIHYDPPGSYDTIAQRIYNVLKALQ